MLQVNMETLESVKEASKGFNSNMDESEKLVKVYQGKEPTVCVQSPKEASRLMPNDDAKRSSEGCINVVTRNSETKRNLLGTQRLKCRRCGSKIRQHRRHKRVRLGTFDTGEEASEAYFSKKSEFEKLEKVKTGKKPIVCLESSKEASSVVANVHGAKSSDGCIDSTVTSNPQAKKNLRGAQRRKSGRYGSSIKDPIRQKAVWLGTFDTAEEASEAYFSKKSEFEKLTKVNLGEELIKCVQSPEQVSCLMANNLGTKSSEGCVNVVTGNPEQASCLMANDLGTKSPVGCINVVTSNTEAKRNLLGTKRLKSGRYGAAIQDPITHKQVWLGTFDTSEEASEACFSKKSEFEILEKVNTGKKPICVESSKEASSLVANVHGAKSSDGCINSSVTSNPKATRSLLGIHRRKSGRYGAAITDPIKHKEVWLGTFDTVEEASEAYFSKKSEFEKLTKVNQGEELIKCVPSPEQASGLMANDLGTKSPVGCINVVTSNTEAKRNLPGTKRLKSGRYGAAIQDPITHNQVWLGTSDTVEEASEAFFSKKSEFEKLSKGNKENKSKNSVQIQPQSPVGALLSVDNDQILATASVGKRNKRIVSHRTTHIIGAHKKKSGKYYSVITNPISKKRIRLGTFVSAKEAAQAYRSKKLEFQKLVEAKQQCNRRTHVSEREKQDGKEKLVDVKRGHGTVNLEGFQPESASGALWSEIDVPMSNSSDGRSEQRIDLLEISHSMGVETRKSGKYSSEGEEAVHAYQCKKLESERSKKAELQSIIPTDSSAGGNQESEEDEDLWMGQWVQLPGDIKEVKFSLKLGLPIIDNYGCLLGEFSSLDDLSIC